ncbi:MAG: hypothetical protein V4474_01245 [Patescibacteria group bacterium]
MKILKIVSTAALLGFAGVALAAAGLTVGVSAPASVSTGNARTLATISLMGGADNVTLTSLPLSLGFAGQTGVVTAASPLTNCHLTNAGGTTLNTGSNTIAAALGSQDITVNFDQALAVPANGLVTLSFVCDVPATVPDGSAFATAIFPNKVTAQTSASTSIAIAGTNVGTTGAAMGVAIISSATTGTPDTGNTGGNPGTPNTGAGGNSAMTWFVLLASAFAAIAAGTYTYRTRKA